MCIKIERFRLWDNEIGPDGAKILANVLKVNLTLQELK